MKKIKIKLLLKVFILILISFCFIMLIFNIVMKNYIDKTAKKAVDKEIYNIRYSSIYNQFYSSESNQTLNMDDVTNKLNIYSIYKENDNEQYNLIRVNSFYINNQYSISNIDWTGYTDSKNAVTEIVDYCKEHPETLNQYRCFKVHIGSTEYYAAQLSGKELIFNNKKEYDTSVYNSIVIIYADLRPINKLINTINFIFIIIFALIGSLICFIGFKIGTSVQNSQQRMKYFFQNASHELKTPIMNIQGYAEGIATNIIKNHDEAANIILSESDRMSGLVEEILLLSKLDTGQLKVRHDEVDAKELLYYLCNRIEIAAKRKKIELCSEFTKDTCIIIGDELQLEKAILNILSNALRYAKSKILIKCYKSKGMLNIIISDDGSGISKKDFPHIFERFYKGEGGINGIGLSLTKEIIQYHNGKVEVTNETGACFHIKLKGFRK